MKPRSKDFYTGIAKPSMLIPLLFRGMEGDSRKIRIALNNTSREDVSQKPGTPLPGELA